MKKTITPILMGVILSLYVCLLEREIMFLMIAGEFFFLDLQTVIHDKNNSWKQPFYILTLTG